MKVVLGLGNPRERDDATRHNVGWWVADRLVYDWDIGPFEREGRALTAEGIVRSHEVRVMKPITYMNRSGWALTALRFEAFDPLQDLLVVVDDAALEVGRVRFRSSGGPGGHKGLESVEAVLGTTSYARLRIGVGTCPADVDLSDWVLSPMPEPEEEVVVGLLPELTEAVETWLVDGTEAAMNRFNR